MALSQGTKLGGYEIMALIGAGGMGEVYRARDERLRRDVAIKILPPDLAPSAEQLARFEREAQSLAALNHPHIAHVYGIEESRSGDGVTTRALVMEFVRGEDLAQRLRRGPLAIDEALRIALQIARALEAAHQHGIIHRDLKPANVKVGDDGNVKLLDFGLAKTVDGAAPAGQGENAPTISSARMTRDGVVLGTAAYMSPEQARGLDVDKRTDVWAFGALLYEMLTGARAFPGDTVSDTVAAVLKVDPDWSLLGPATPPLVRRTLAKCLHKDVRERLADIHDARLDLTDALSDAPPPGASHRTRSPWLAWGLGLAVILAAAAAIGMASSRLANRLPPSPLVRSSLIVPDQRVADDPALSPDGRGIVYSALQPRRGLWLRRLDETTARFLAGTEGATRPFWSPDGTAVAFFANGMLKSIQPGSGVVTQIVALPTFFGGAWSSGGVIVFGLRGNSGLLRVSAGGGPATALTTLEASDIAHRWPFVFPDGDSFGYVVQREAGYQLMIGSLGRGGAATAVTAVDSSVILAPPDTLLIARAGSLFAHRVNLRDRTLSAEGVKIAEQVGVLPTRETSVSASAAGELVYLPPRTLPRGRLAWVDRSGRVSYLALPEGTYGEPSLSPDGSKVALSVREPSGADLWMYDIERGTFGRRTFSGASTFAVWSPDGRRLTFTRAVAQNGPLMEIAADGSGDARVIVNSTDTPGLKSASSWSPDGTALLFQLGNDVMLRRADGSIEPVLSAAAAESEGRFSPNGRWIAYRSNETGADNVFVQSFPIGHGKWQISSAGGSQPMWAPDGRELYFVNGNRMMVVSIDQRQAFKPGVPRVLFQIPLPEREAGDPSRFAVSPDGKRFLVLTTEQPLTPPQSPVFHLVVNWRALLSKPGTAEGSSNR